MRCPLTCCTCVCQHCVPAAAPHTVGGEGRGEVLAGNLSLSPGSVHSDRQREEECGRVHPVRGCRCEGLRVVRVVWPTSTSTFSPLCRMLMSSSVRPLQDSQCSCSQFTVLAHTPTHTHTHTHTHCSEALVVVHTGVSTSLHQLLDTLLVAAVCAYMSLQQVSQAHTHSWRPGAEQ